jgi:hypothetical protein
VPCFRRFAYTPIPSSFNCLKAWRSFIMD